MVSGMAARCNQRRPQSQGQGGVQSEGAENPVKWAKANTNLGTSAKVFHVFDFEDEEPIHVKAFKDMLENMKKAGSLGRGFRYVSAYSNLTFELWIVLHKDNCPTLTHRRQYLKPINDLYGEHFKSLDEYKHEANFKRVLGKLTVDNAVAAVNRAEMLASAQRSTASAGHSTAVIATIWTTLPPIYGSSSSKC